MDITAKTPEWRNVSRDEFEREIAPLNRPAILRGAVADWPAVRACAGGASATAAYLRQFDQGRPLISLTGAPAIKGRFFYGDNLGSVNFQRRRETLSAVLDRVLSVEHEAEPPTVFIQSATVPEIIPGFAAANVLPLLDARVIPRIWIGNSAVVQTHFDPMDNIACCVAGRRRFMLFPPEQLPNLYCGPLDASPGGAPVSLASPLDPDFERFPRFREAMAHAEIADLEPGDALFVPYMWWHHVQSTGPLNVLVNYWWNDAPAHLGTPFDCLLHAVMALRDLPPHQRAVWQGMFQHYVFQENGAPMEHVPEQYRGMMGAMTPERARQIRADLVRLLSQPV